MSDDKIPALLTAFNVFNATHGRPAEDRLAAFLASLAASGFAIVPLIDKFKLQALENGGVDNWDWYGDAMEEAENMLAAAQENSHE